MFTVIGYYESTGQAFAGQFEANDAQHAMQLSAESSDFDGDFVIVGAISGAHALNTASDNGGTTCACDFDSEEEEGE